MTFDDFREIWVLDFEFGEDKDHLLFKVFGGKRDS